MNMAYMVLDEIDIEYYLYLDIYSNVKDARNIQEAKFNVGSTIGDWLNDRGVHYSTMNNPSKDLIKCIVYANLTEELQVEYLLRFN